MKTTLDFSRAQMDVDDRRFLVRQGNTIFLLYTYGGSTPRPHIATLIGPSGRNVLEDSPADHVHHHGVWWGHGDVNGVDFYLEVPDGGRRLGSIRPIDRLSVTDDHPRYGVSDLLGWYDDHDEVLLTEKRTLALHLADPEHYTVDLHSVYTAERDLAFGDTKESVMPGIRIAESLTGVCGGTITASHGGVGEPETMGKPAAWIDYHGPRTAAYGRGEVTEGIACFDHPSNPHHPPLFFARAYGPISPFQGHHFLGPAEMGAGQRLETRHRLLVHSGSTTEADVAGHYRRWVGP